MEGAGVVGGQDGEKGKATRGRRTWSKIEEDALIQCLTDIVNNGWKADNGFKSGFQRELEKGMKKLMPGTDLVANPHINSKIHVWKKEYGSLFDLLSKSGIGWNCTTNTIYVIDEEAWENQKNTDPHVKTMRYKSWPYYGFWQEIFGKDRATGEHDVGAMDLVNELLKTEATGSMDLVEKVGENTNNPYEIPEHVPEATSVCKPSELGSKKSKGTKRKSGESGIYMLADKLGDFIQSSDSTFNNLAQRFGNEHEAKASRTSLIEIMNKVPGLKLHDKLKAADELVQNTNRLELFLSLPEEERHEYVWMLLDGRL
ncbi:hypothetical protein ACS0TY_034293 [Phlomoides rotata]